MMALLPKRNCIQSWASYLVESVRVHCDRVWNICFISSSLNGVLNKRFKRWFSFIIFDCMLFSSGILWQWIDLNRLHLRSDVHAFLFWLCYNFGYIGFNTTVNGIFKKRERPPREEEVAVSSLSLSLFLPPVYTAFLDSVIFPCTFYWKPNALCWSF